MAVIRSTFVPFVLQCMIPAHVSVRQWLYAKGGLERNQLDLCHKINETDIKQHNFMNTYVVGVF